MINFINNNIYKEACAYKISKMTTCYKNNSQTIIQNSRLLQIKQKNIYGMKKQIQSLIQKQKQLSNLRRQLPKITKSKLQPINHISPDLHVTQFEQNLIKYQQRTKKRQKSIEAISTELQNNKITSNLKNRQSIQNFRNQLKLRTTSKKNIKNIQNQYVTPNIVIVKDCTVNKRCKSLQQNIISTLKKKQIDSYRQVQKLNLSYQPSIKDLIKSQTQLKLQIEKVNRIRSKNMKSKLKHQTKFVDVLDMINRKIKIKDNVKKIVTISPIKIHPQKGNKIRSRFYSEVSHDLNQIQTALMKTRTQMMEQTNNNIIKKQENLNKSIYHSLINQSKNSDINNNSYGNFVLVFDKYKYKSKKNKNNTLKLHVSRPQPMIKQSNQNISNYLEDKNMYSPWESNQDNSFINQMNCQPVQMGQHNYYSTIQ